MVYAAAAYAVGAGLSYLGSSKAAREAKREKRRLRAEQQRAFKRGLSAIRGGIYPRMNYVLGQGEKMIREGYDSALRETSGLQNVGARRIVDARDRAKSDAQQNLTSRGLSGTTAVGSSNRAIERDTQVALSENNAAFAQLRAQLHAGRAGALAQHYGMRWQAESQAVWSPFFSLMTGMDGFGEDYIASERVSNFIPIESPGAGAGANGGLI